MAPDTDTPPVGKLRDRLESFLFKELRRARVFRDLTRFDPKPNMVLAGHVDAFHERYREHLWTCIPYVDKVGQYLYLKSPKSRGEAAMTLYLLRPNGERGGAYSGKSTFDESLWMSDPNLRLAKVPGGSPSTVESESLWSLRRGL